MAFQNMTQELLGVAGTNLGLVQTKINEAFMAIQNENTWSFQLQTGGWLTPGLLGSITVSGGSSDGIVPAIFLSPGTITITPYTNTLLGDAVATAAWVAQIFNPPFITQYQFRVPYYSLYSATALQFAGTVAYLAISFAGAGQTPGSYVVNGVGGSGGGAQVRIVVDADGTVTQIPVVLNPGSGYTVGGVANPPTFTVPNGTSATFNVVNNAIIILDRPWMEPAQLNAGYMAYQAYYAYPAGYKRTFNIRDTTNNNSMDWWTKTQINLATDDAERTIFDQPYNVVPFQIDNRQGSATMGQQLVELWPHPITELPYTFQVQCNWPALVNPQDTVPYPLTEEIVKMRAYEMISLWKEMQKGDEMERGSGTNWQFMAKAMRDEYENRLKRIRIMDRHLIEVYFTKARMGAPYGGEPFSNVSGQLNVGWM